MIDEMELRIKVEAVRWAWETHFQRFNVADKPKAEEVIEAAKKFEAYFRGEDDDSIA